MKSKSKRIVHEVWPFAEPLLHSWGLELVDVEFVFETGRWVLRIYMDKEEGVSLEDCAEVSRELGDLIDAEDIIDFPYVLEVSSPGLNRPLKKEHDFVRSIGKLVELTTTQRIDNRRNFTGRLTDVKAGIVSLSLDDNHLVELPLRDVEKARLKYEFNK